MTRYDWLKMSNTALANVPSFAPSGLSVVVQ